MFCKNCGKQLPDGARFCAGCGTKLDPVPVAPVQPAPQTPPMTPTPPVPPVQPMPVYTAPAAPAPYQKPKKKKGLLITLLIVIPLVLALIGVGVWFIIDNLDSEGQSQGDDDKNQDEDEKSEEELAADYEAAVKLLEEKKYDKALEAFKALGDYEDSAEQVENLEQLQRKYDAAQELVIDKKYDDAIKAFEKLDDYRDSKEMIEKGIPYEIALDEYDEAESIEDYLRVAEVFEELLGYNDAVTMASHAYLNVCRIYLLEEGDVESAMEYAEHLNEWDYEGFQTVYKDNSADSTILADLEQALKDRVQTGEDNESMDYSLVVQAEWKYLDRYEDKYFIDEDLEDLIHEYIKGLQIQTEALEGTDYPYDMVAWYEGAALRCEIINELYDEYGFLKDNDELVESYIGMTMRFEANVDIEIALQKQLWGVPATQAPDGTYYLEFENTTDFDFSIYFLHRYGQDGYVVGPEYEEEFVVKSGETILIPQQFPDDFEWNEWYIDWSFGDVYFDGTLLG